MLKPCFLCYKHVIIGRDCFFPRFIFTFTDEKFLCVSIWKKIDTPIFAVWIFNGTICWLNLGWLPGDLWGCLYEVNIKERYWIARAKNQSPCRCSIKLVRRRRYKLLLAGPESAGAGAAGEVNPFAERLPCGWLRAAALLYLSVSLQQQDVGQRALPSSTYGAAWPSLRATAASRLGSHAKVQLPWWSHHPSTVNT